MVVIPGSGVQELSLALHSGITLSGAHGPCQGLKLGQLYFVLFLGLFNCFVIVVSKLQIGFCFVLSYWFGL